MAQHSDARRTLWFLWLSITALGLGIGAGLAELVSSAVAGESGYHLLFSPCWQIAVGFCFGVPALLMQYFALRAFLPGALRWMAATTLGLLIGAAVGGFVGIGAGVVMLQLGVGCEAASLEACGAGFFFLTFPAAGGAAGAVVGSIMGTLLRMGPREWQ